MIYYSDNKFPTLKFIKKKWIITTLMVSAFYCCQANAFTSPPIIRMSNGDIINPNSRMVISGPDKGRIISKKRIKQLLKKSKKDEKIGS